MTIDELITQGNHFRAISQPEKAIACYAQAFLQNPKLGAAYNNYGNVIREMGFPRQAIGFLLNAIDLNPNDSIAQFNLAVAYLLAGDLDRGWRQYEKRWHFEHLDGKLPQLAQPRWQGESLQGRTILVTGEQGHGDNIQFVRFVEQLITAGAGQVIVSVDPSLKTLLQASFTSSTVVVSGNDILPPFDVWSPIMSVPGFLGITYENLPYKMQYLTASKDSMDAWRDRLGLKRKLRVGFCWSGRRDSWINQHKAVPFAKMFELVKCNPQYEWINLQTDCSQEEEAQLLAEGVKAYPGTITCWNDTAGLIQQLDVVVAVDTAVGHLSGAMGRPFWLPLNQFGQDWRWLLDRNDSPWYSSCRIFRQPSIGNWDEPLARIHNNLKLFKI